MRASWRSARSACPGTASKAPPTRRPRSISAAASGALMERGRRRFERLLNLAVRFDLPVIVHAPHGAAQMALHALKAKGVERAIFHWHKSPLDVTRAILDAGYLVSVTPEVVYRERDRELVEAVPLESLLVLSLIH